MAKLRLLWESWRSSLWFVPTVLVLGAVVLAQGWIEIDAHIDRTNLQSQWPRLFGAGAAGSRGMLTAIASSMITVAGVAFSITIVALALASSQYTSRILRNFMRDRASQTVLGAFVGIFVYCLMVLRSIRGGDEGAFVPSLAVLFAVALAFVGIGCLIFFIHHIASSIQAESIIQSAAHETIDAIDRLFPAEMGEATAADISPGRSHPRAWKSGNRSRHVEPGTSRASIATVYSASRARRTPSSAWNAASAISSWRGRRSSPLPEVSSRMMKQPTKTFYFCSDHCRQKFLSTPTGAQPEAKTGSCCG